MAVPVPKKRISSELPSGFFLEYAGKKSLQEIEDRKPCNYTISEKFQGIPNRLYHGDNISALATLCSLKDICGHVKLVYIDPPYATAAAFESRTQQHAYDDTLIGPEFIETLRERIVFLHKILSEDGSIYIHIDSRMVFYVKIVLDEVFGPQNFRNCITRQKCNPKNYTRKTYGNILDYILFYSKSSNYRWNRSLVSWEQERAEKEYQYTDENGRKYKKVPVHAPGVRNGDTGKEWRGKLPPPGKHWQYTPAKLDEMDANGDIYWSPTGNPRRKIYLEESDGIPVQDIWSDVKDAYNQNIRITGYPTEKNIDLLRRIIKASSNPGDLVLDCYAGSGTTLVAASELGRRWIGVDQSEEAIKTILHRFENGTSAMGDFVTNKKNENIFELKIDRISDFTMYTEDKSPTFE